MGVLSGRTRAISRRALRPNALGSPVRARGRVVDEQDAPEREEAPQAGDLRAVSGATSASPLQ